MTRFGDVAPDTCFADERAMMRKARRDLVMTECNKIKTMKECANFLETTIGKFVLLCEGTDADNPHVKLSYDVVDDDNCCHVILKDDYTLNQLKEEKTAHVVGTSSNRPHLKDCYQLTTVIIRKDKMVCIVLIMLCKKSGSFDLSFLE